MTPRIIIFCVLLLLPLQVSRADTLKKPNIVLFLCDDLGYAEIGCYGQEKSDPSESQNVAAKNPEVTAKLRERFASARSESENPDWNFTPKPGAK